MVMNRPKPPEIRTVDELAAWLLAVRPRAACVIAQSAVTPSEVHFITIGGDKLAAQAFFVGGEPLMKLIENLDPSLFAPDESPVPRAERRRMERRR
jgi:hypothetical protein